MATSSGSTMTPLTAEEKQLIGEAVNQASPQLLQEIVAILQEHNGGSDEIDLDIEELPTHVQRRLLEVAHRVPVHVLPPLPSADDQISNSSDDDNDDDDDN